MYLRLAYGLTKNLTMSVESGYYLNKTQVGLNKVDTFSSAGIGDLILFPRYDVLNRTSEKKRTEITLGIGLKIPLGMYDDSTLFYTNPYTGKQLFRPSPPSVQPSTGANDFIFYGFFYRGYPEKKFRIFMNTLYVRKGWSPIGAKFGDYASVGLFAGQTFFKKLGVTIQIKGEMIGKMKASQNADDMMNMYNVDIVSTGSRKILFVPQLSYSYKNFSVYALTEIPLYQYVNKVQVASHVQATVGISYRFNAYKKIAVKSDSQSLYVCPMGCVGSESNEPGKCKECGMELIKRK
ncbi:MAG: hypothetical protein NTX97_08865 [Bacteroidetes bacterium]|nr:hypothetical protein [Bacteroidota bacterium]